MIEEKLNSFKDKLQPATRLLGLDIGERKIGLAVSDTTRVVASPHGMVMRKSHLKDVAEIKTIIERSHVSGMVIGLPIEMSGVEGESCKMVRQFCAMISEHISLPIYLQDERLSTAAARRILSETSLTRKKKEQLDDKMAASFILQTVLDNLNYGFLA